jgi:hypothetical protein
MCPAFAAVTARKCLLRIDADGTLPTGESRVWPRRESGKNENTPNAANRSKKVRRIKGFAAARNGRRNTESLQKVTPMERVFPTNVLNVPLS